MGSTVRFRVWQLLDKEIVAIATGIVLGYLVGVLLRLLRCESLDALSAKWLKRFDSGAREPSRSPEQQESKDGPREAFKEYVTDPFPYFNWIRRLCKENYGSTQAKGFFKRNWDPIHLKQKDENNRQFFNFRKMLIASARPSGVSEVNAAESFTRYMALMFYALVLSSSALSVVALIRACVGQPVWHFASLAVTYLVSTFLIVIHFRSIRIKEVETLFVADLQMHGAGGSTSGDGADDEAEQPPGTLRGYGRRGRCA